MKKDNMNHSLWQRLGALALSVVLVFGMLPSTSAAESDSGTIVTVDDPATLTRPETIYGDNTVNAGKVTVGKSVSDTDITVNGQNIAIDGENNFLVTISQSAQVMGLSSQTSVPVDVVFVIDTSGSMDDNDRAESLVVAANSAISALMDANDQNRVAVVAFSSEGYGDGTSGGAAANVLSSLAHYTGDAADAHLQWVDSEGDPDGNNKVYIAGRDTATITIEGDNWWEEDEVLTVNAYRHGKNGGTNIQAGIVAGAKILTGVPEADTTWTNPDTNETVTRIPFVIVISDGQPTFSYDDDTWYDPTITGSNAADEQGPGSGSYEGNGFIAALTAAYYKGLITEHYYGDAASAENHCFVYTMGVEIEALDDYRNNWNQTVSYVDDNQSLAQITLDPANYAVDGQAYYTYGNAWNNDQNRTTTHGWKTYWNNYLAGNRFDVRVDSGDEYTFTAASITASKTYVNGIGYTGGLQYNDEYFAADDVADMEAIFDSLIATIQQKAISVPTQVTTGDHDFDGYVHFYDPIGEYMEVKDLKGVLADGYFYQGASAARYLMAYGTANNNDEFDALLYEVLKTRMGLSESDDRFTSEAELDAFIDELLSFARDSAHQANYTDGNNFDNSIVWWGNAYDAGEEDDHVQVLGFADNDTIEFIEAQRAAGSIPEGADYVCRSYFFYGEAGGSNPNPDHEYLYFMVRVQRELTFPYRETVVISAPASLLSMEKVLVTETFDDDGNPVYTATVEHQEPARVVYEVGLWDSITPETVSGIVSTEYATETVNGPGSVNYDAATDTYYFFTNDWDRTQSLESHHRGMAKATFDAAADNAFYTYQEDTLLVDAYGAPVTSNPAGTTAYYVREYYEWEDNDQDGTYSATKKTVLIEVQIPAEAELVQDEDGNWYIPAGAYTAATLVVNGDDTMKDDPTTETKDDGNNTGTSAVVAHPERTGDATNSHYTVYLGNNGKLGMKANNPEPKKTVSVNLPDAATAIVDDEGKAVQVGDVLTYTVEVQNTLAVPADITVTDYVPLGTAFVPGSAGSGTAPTGHTKDASIAPDSNNILTWVLEDVPAGETRYVSFQVTVTEAALSLSVVPGSIDNTAQVKLNDGSAFDTNTTHTPSYGKTVTDTNNNDIDGDHGFKVGDILVYHIRFHNNAMVDGAYVAADVTVTDKIPEGTTFISADNGGSYDAATGNVTWTFEDMEANTAQVVSFTVQINASAKINGQGTQHETGEIYLPNTATIVVDNEPDITLTTNTTENWADVGDMVLEKSVVSEGTQYNDKEFTLTLTESTGLLDGTYVLERGNAKETVTFTQGKASVTIKHGEKLTIRGLPAGVIITVAETVPAGWTAAYNTQSVTIVKGAATTVSSVTVTNTYAVQPVTVVLKGEKTLNGIDIPGEAKTFGFVAVPDANNTEVGDPLTGEVTVQETGAYEFTFSPKVFTKPGTYKYTIYEINGGILGVTYAETQYTLVITVKDNGDGTMSATATLDGEAFDLANGEVTFTNTYTPEDTQLVLTADKSLSGRTLIPGEFSFVLKDDSGNVVSRGINDANGNIVFESITYTETGTYTYTLSEVVPADADGTMRYDTKTYTVVVVVTDANGQLVPTVTVDGTAKTVENGVVDTDITFTNSFEPNDVPLTLMAKKTLMVYNGTEYVATNPAAGEFRFQVVDKYTGSVVTTGVNAADGTIIFNTFYFSADMLADVTPDASGTRTKTFTYVISEVEPFLAKDPNMLYDLEGREIQVTLSYTSEGVLTVAVGTDSDGNVDLTGSVNFINYSNPDSVEIQPVGTKTTTNAPAGVSFSFSVINTETGNEAAAGVGDANGNITFSTMSFSEPGAYTYWIVESNAGNTTNGITYDLTRYLMKVEVSRNEYNRLVANVTYWTSAEDGSENVADYTIPAEAPSFQNEYNAGGYINLTAKKVLNGRTLKAGEFAFKLTRQDNGGEIDGIVAADGTITFSTMYYSLDDIPEGQTSTVIHYVMSEVIPTSAALPGVTYDDTKYDVYVRITDNGDGTITAELVEPDGNGGYTAITGNDTGVTFTNTYAAVHGDTIKFQIKKTLNGRILREGEFDFLLWLNGSVVDIATNDANGIVTFTRDIPATATPGIYEMVITEATGSLGGVTYDPASYTIYLKIEDDGNGNIVATLVDAAGKPLPETNGVVDLTGSIYFVNTYEPHDTTYTPEASKTLTGRDLAAGEFSFQVQLISKDGAPVDNGTVYNGVNAADGTIVFETIHYTDAGTYIYKLSEVSNTTTSVVKYDTSVYYLKVVVADNGNGHLVASATYHTDAACASANAAVTFANTYTPADVSVQLEGTKSLTGRDLNDKEFSFVVRENDVNGDIVATGSNDGEGNILFSTFEITAEDMVDENGNRVYEKVFTYVVVESDNKLGGVAYDDAVFTVTVTVTDDGNGVLSAEVVYVDGPIAFKNTYTPAPTELPLVAFKTLNGKNLKDGEFTFVLEGPGVRQTVTNDGNGVVTFENLKFTEAGTYVYTLSEVVPDPKVNGMGYDTTVYTITVTVTDDGNGNLTATAVYSNGEKTVDLLQFTNTYTPPAIDVELEGTKSIVDPDGNALTGENYSLAGFVFEVYDAEGNYVTEAVSDADGNIKFTGFQFTAAGVYRFLISEKTTDKAGYTTDPTVWCVHITIGYNADTGALYEDGEPYVHLAPETHGDVVAQASETLSFVNVYDPADVSLTLKALKDLDGRDLADREFTFYMVDKATGLRAAEGYNDANGVISFHLTYTEAGTYTYTIYEYVPAEDEKLGGVDYSTETYEVTVTVTDDGSGALKVQVGEITAVGSGTVDLTGTVVFHNTYTPDPIDVTIEALKRMEGRPLADGAYTFQLVNANDPEEVYEATNGADGKVVFEKLTYTEAGVYEYTLTEVIGTAGGVTYDSTVYDVTVTVTDDGKGNLSATVVYSREGATLASPVFVNAYSTGSTSVTLTGHKTLTGRDLKAGEFSFQLKDSDGNVIETVTNDADGNIKFSALKYTFEDMAGKTEQVFEYTVSEVIETGTVTYDETVYTVIVTVTDNGDGTLTASVVRKIGNENVTLITFVNHFDVKDTDVVLEGTKNLTGLAADGLTNGEFSFSVYESDSTGTTKGDLVSSGINAAGDASANIIFAPIGFTVEDMTGTDGNIAASKDFWFLVVEDVPAADGPTFDANMYYDPAEYLVKVTVTYDSAAGTLSTAVTYPEGGLVFSNIQNPESITEHPEGVKHTTGENLPADLRFSFKVVPIAADGSFDLSKVAATGTSAPTQEEDGANKTITFTELVYTDEDLGDQDSVTFRYWIMESNVAVNDNGVDYDDTWYLYVVTLSRDETNALFTTEAYYGLKDGGDKTDPADYTVKVDSISFNNEYEAEAHINLSATKKLEGMDLDANAFDFRLQRLDHNTWTLVAGSAVNGTNDASGVVTFATLNFSSAMLDDLDDQGNDTYYAYYLMGEIEPEGVAIPGVTYDKQLYIVTIKLTHHADGSLTAEQVAINEAVKTETAGDPTYTIGAYAEYGAVFTNTYTVETGVDVTIEADKTLTGRDLRTGEFGFVLYRYDAAAKVWHNIGTAFNDAHGNISFTRHYSAATLSHLAFDEDRDNDGDPEYTVIYRVDEINNHLGGIEYSGDSFYIEVVIEHDISEAAYIVYDVNYYADEELKQPVDDIVFENTYSTGDSNEIVIEGTKVLENMTLKAGTYSFVLKDSTGKVLQTVTHDAEGQFSFEALKYTFADLDGKTQKVFTYTVSEVKGNKGGITYDETIYTVTVTVTDDGAGNLTAVAVYSIGTKVVDAEDVVFTNTYAAAAVDVVIQAEKDLLGKNLKAGEFEFVLTDKDGKQIKATNAADGTVTFEKLTFSTVGEYVYTLTETKGNMAGVTYDTTVYTVNVTVTDNGEGKLEAAVVYTKDSKAQKTPVFTNFYKGASVTTDVEATKKLTGKILTAGQFTFELVNVNDPTDKYTAVNGADGSILFEDIQFTETGVYTYKLYEVKGIDKNMDYDDTVYTVTITVSDDLNGKLVAKVAYSAEPVFRNVHTPDSVTVTLEGSKELTGRDLVDGEFTFEVRDADGNLVTTGTNTADGTIKFVDIVIGTEMDLILHVTEVKGTNSSIKYDDYNYRVRLTVTNDNGVLEASVTYLDGDIVFYNTYEVPETPPTGDDTPVYAYTGMMALSALALSALLLLGRKKKERKFF